MKTRTNKEWEFLYRRFWRQPFAELPKELRAKLVRGCQGKAVYESCEEALKVIAELPIRAGLYLKAYSCPLCYEYIEVDGVRVMRYGIHIGNSRDANQIPARAIRPTRSELHTGLD